MTGLKAYERKWKITFRADPREAFFGVRFDDTDFGWQSALDHKYRVRLREWRICILPMLPIRVMQINTIRKVWEK